MTFNEKRLEEFTSMFLYVDDIEQRRYFRQALVDKEKEVLERVMKCIGYTYESKLGQAVNRKCDGNEGFNLGVKSSYHDSKRRLEEEFKQ